MSLIKRSQYRTQDISQSPGVYIFRDQFKQVIYVGKAKSLRKRLGNYFQASRLKTADAKLRSLINSIAFFEIHIVHSESEALILEDRFIKEYAPKYNILLRDDKRFLLIKIHLNDTFPKLILTRIRKDDGARYFGPFPKASALRETLDFLSKYFHLRTCTPQIPDEKDFRHCHASILANCCAPCNGQATEEEYHQHVNELIKVLSGKIQDLIIDLNDEMLIYSEAGRFEKAGTVRDIIENLKSIFKPQRNFRKSTLGFKAGTLAVEDLQAHLKLSQPPKVIECFDNSNFQGTNAVASMVQFRDGHPSPKNYRHFKIKTVEGIDDFASMREIVKRRYSRILKEGTDMPDMVLIDGGKGQLSSAYNILKDMGVDIPVYGLAKRYEILYQPNDSDGIFLPLESPSLKLLQHLRDEAHRFAITFHRSLRNKRITDSILDDINGIGKIRKMQILKEFGSVKNLRTKDPETLLKRVPGIGAKMAETIFEHLKRNKKD
jgi:excinuclease ABC subunit C